MSLFRHTIDIACKGDPSDVRAMWLAISRARENSDEREFSPEGLFTAEEAGPGDGPFGRVNGKDGFSSSSVIDPGAFFNSVREDIPDAWDGGINAGPGRGNPEKFYPLLAKAFPRLEFFIVQERSDGGTFFLASFESKNGRMRASGSWEYKSPRLSKERRAWLGALQGHWLMDSRRGLPEAAPGLELQGGIEAGAPEEAPISGKDAELLVRENPDALARIKKQTPRICRAAVQTSGLALRHVRKQSAKICLAAVKQNGMALQFVNEQTRELCRAALTQNYLSYGYIRETTPSLFKQFTAAFQDRMAAIQAEEQAG